MNLRERFHGLDKNRQALMLAAIWMLLGSLLWIWWDERTLPDVGGHWSSRGCETVRSVVGVSRLKRDLRLDESSWRLKVDFYGDADCTKGLFSVETEGPYRLGPKSFEPRDATLIRFDLGKLTLTPDAPEAAAKFDQARCGDGNWKVGEGQEVTQEGCLGLVPTLDTCPAEYDIVKIQDGALYLGDRSLGLCEPDRYPVTFAPAPLEKIIE
ncbi:MAG TPA: hypothetical protein VJ694_02690 [Patescibacteria group bacterium]|nr:hypothetical protein [Patescibacteria group bacterium]